MGSWKGWWCGHGGREARTCMYTLVKTRKYFSTSFIRTEGLCLIKRLSYLGEEHRQRQAEDSLLPGQRKEGEETAKLTTLLMYVVKFSPGLTRYLYQHQQLRIEHNCPSELKSSYLKSQMILMTMSLVSTLLAAYLTSTNYGVRQGTQLQGCFGPGHAQHRGVGGPGQVPDQSVQCGE